MGWSLVQLKVNLFLKSALQIRGRELDGPTLAALMLTSTLSRTSLLLNQEGTECSAKTRTMFRICWAMSSRHVSPPG